MAIEAGRTDTVGNRVKVKKIRLVNGREAWKVSFPPKFSGLDSLYKSLPLAHSYAMYYVKLLRRGNYV